MAQLAIARAAHSRLVAFDNATHTKAAYAEIAEQHAIDSKHPTRRQVAEAKVAILDARSRLVAAEAEATAAAAAVPQNGQRVARAAVCVAACVREVASVCAHGADVELFLVCPETAALRARHRVADRVEARVAARRAP